MSLIQVFVLDSTLTSPASGRVRGWRFDNRAFYLWGGVAGLRAPKRTHWWGWGFSEPQGASLRMVEILLDLQRKMGIRRLVSGSSDGGEKKILFGARIRLAMFGFVRAGSVGAGALTVLRRERRGIDVWGIKSR